MVLYKYIYIGVTMNNSLIGKRVIYNSDRKYLQYYPPKGTQGTILSEIICGYTVMVHWDKGTKPGIWYCQIDDLTFVEGNNE